MKRKLTSFLFSTLLLMSFLVNIQDGFTQISISCPTQTVIADNCGDATYDPSNPNYGGDATFTGESCATITYVGNNMGSPTGNGTLSYSDVVNGSCSAMTSTVGGGSYTISRTWVVIDCNGDSDTCTQTIEINDSTPPQFPVPAVANVMSDCIVDTLGLERPTNITDNCDQTASPGIVPYITNIDIKNMPGAGYNITGLTPPYTTDPIASNIINPGCKSNFTQILYMVTWTVEDACGNSNSEMIEYMVHDDVNDDPSYAPVISCPSNILLNCNANLDPYTNPSVPQATATDNCTASFGNPGSAVAFTPGTMVAGMDAMIYYMDGPAGPYAPGSTFTRTWQAQDDCGNVSFCSHTITLGSDNTPPVITCPTDISIECDMTIPSTTSMVMVSDDCDTAPNVTFADVSTQTSTGACTDYTYTITRTFTATDASGNSSTCNQTIFVEDTTGPVLTAPTTPTVLGCAASTAPTMASDFPGVSDNCDGTSNYTALGINVTYFDIITSIPPGTCDVATIDRIFTVTDACGNSSTIMHTFTIRDNGTPNSFTDASGSLDRTIGCNASTDPNVNTTLGMPTLQCGVSFDTPAYTDVVSMSGCTTTTTRTWSATNACGGNVTFTQTISSTDTNNPVLDSASFPADITLGCEDYLNGNYNDLTITGAAPTATDGCVTPTVTRTDDFTASTNPPPAMSPTGQCSDYDFVLVRTWRAVDACGNQSTPYVQNITFVDNTAPTVGVWPNDVTINCPTNPSDKLPFNTGYNASATMGSISDGCDMDFSQVGDITYSDVVMTGTCPLINVINRTWMVTDDCGNAATHLQQIFVNDNLPPALTGTIPADITISCSDNPNDLMITGAAPTAADAACCNPSSPVTVTYSDSSTIPSGACGNYTTMRNWMASDACGNSANLGTQMITVIDVVAPTISSFPPDATVSCGASFSVGSVGIPVASDNCLGSGVLYEFEDYTTATGGAPFTAYQDASAVSHTYPTPMFGTPCNPFVVYRQWRISDDCGNMVIYDGSAAGLDRQVLSVEDNTPPSFDMATFPADVTVSCGMSTVPNSTGTGQPTATDFCTNVALSFSDVNSTGTGSCPANIITRTFIATDDCGNSATQTQMITVQDNMIPTISTVADVTISCSFSTDPSVNSAVGQATGTDDCGSLMYAGNAMPSANTITYTDSNSTNCGTFIRTWRAEDACGQFATSTQTITRDDSTVPTITCPADATISSTCPTAMDFDPSNNTSLGIASATDNCTSAFTYSGTTAATPSSITYMDGASTCSGTGANNVEVIRTWTATDECGNTATCTQKIIYTDNTAPTIMCPANVTIECTDSTDPMMNTALGMATAMDCDPNINIVWMDVSNTSTGVNDCNYTITRQWMATDACGNSDVCNQIITIDDNTLPVFTSCPSDVTFSCGDSSNPSVNPSVGIASASDNCTAIFNYGGNAAPTNAAITYLDSAPVSGSCISDFSFVRTWTATDECGNMVTCDQTINYIDNIPPTFTSTPVDITITCTDNPASSNTGTPSVTDNCSEPVSVVESDSAPATCNTTFIRTFVITDGCGNTAFYNQNITVGTPTGIIITSCPANLTVECGMSTAPSATGMPSATTNCNTGGLSSTMNDVTSIGSCSGESTITRTWTFTDNCGNTNATCSQTINIVDNTPPVVTSCPADVTINCGANTLPSNTGSPTATESCSSAMMSYSDSGSGACGTTIVRTWSIMDACGNTATTICTQNITLDNTVTPLTITCPAAATLTCGTSANPSTNPSVGTATASGGCGTGTTTITYTGGTTNCMGSNASFVRTWVATDGCGNTATCNQTITFTGVAAAAFMSPPADMNIACGAAFPSNPNLNYSNGQTGRCLVSGGPIAPMVDDSGLNTATCTGCRVVTWSTTDACGTGVSYVQNICYQNTNCPNNVVLTGFNNGSNSNTQTTDDTEVNINITSNQTILASTSGIDYDAGVDIDLLPGFTVQLGAEFHAFIDGCGGAMIQDDEDNTVNGLNADEEGSTDTKENKNTPDVIQQEEE